MNERIQIKESQALEQLKRGLARFAGEGKQSMDRINNIHNKIRNQLQQQLISKQRKLEHSRNRGSHGYAPVSQQLNKIRQAISEVEKQIGMYQKAAARMRRLMDHNTMQAKVMLHVKIIEIFKYLAITMGMERFSQAYPGLKNLVSGDSGTLPAELPILGEEEPLQAGLQQSAPSAEVNEFHVRYFEQTRILEVNGSSVRGEFPHGSENGS